MRQAAAKRTVSFKLAVVLVSAFFAVVAMELTLWVFWPAPRAERMDWRPDGHVAGRGVPGSSFTIADGSRVHFNRLGFRGPDPTWDPAPGRLRIIAFGGSSTFDLHAHGEEETWVGVLGSSLREGLGMDVEVINAGIPGYSSVHSKINYLVTGRQLHPDVVILCHTWNDMKKFRPLDEGPQDLIFAGVTGVELDEPPLWRTMARKLQIYQLLRTVYYLHYPERQENPNVSPELGGPAARMPVPAAFDWARQNFEDFCRFARNDNVLPVLLSQPTIAVRENLDDPKYRVAIRDHYVQMTQPVIADSWSMMTDIIKDVASEEDGIFVDGYSGVPHDLLYFTDHVHLTRDGSLRLGKFVAESLLAAPEFVDRADRVRRGKRQRGVGREAGEHTPIHARQP